MNHPTHELYAPTLSVVVPLLNEAEVLKQSYTELRRELEKTGETFEIIFVDDGSTDHSLVILRQIALFDPRVRIIVLSRNFGHEMATSAGLHHAAGKAAIVIDADLQDPPELIHEFVAKWKEGYHVVYGVRAKREGESAAKRLTAFLFYRIMRHMSDVPIPADTGDFRLMDRRVLDIFREMKDDPRFFRGLIPWIGFRQVGVPFVRRPRAAGKSKYRPARLFRLAYDTLTSFSTYTSQLASLFGFGMAALSFVAMGVVAVLSAAGVLSLPGWAWVAGGFLLLWNVQFLFLTMLGEYIVRTHRMTQRRPLYVIDQVIQGSSSRLPPVEIEEEVLA
jgi:glycosyltransferase involved in cell wall biosynthesis